MLKTVCDNLPKVKDLRYDKITNHNTEKIYFKHL